MHSDEERSAHFEQLMLAEESGKKNKKGMHSSREPPVHHVNDVSLPNIQPAGAPTPIHMWTGTEPLRARLHYLYSIRTTDVHCMMNE